MNRKWNALFILSILHFVGVQMSSQVHFAHERYAAFLAREWLETFMLSTVCDEIWWLTEWLATEAALVWFFARVDVGMFLHVRFLVKSLSAEMAFERARVWVNQHVRRQRGWTLETFAARFALEWLFAWVHNHMLLQTDGIIEHFVTDLAVIQLFRHRPRSSLISHGMIFPLVHFGVVNLLETLPWKLFFFYFDIFLVSASFLGHQSTAMPIHPLIVPNGNHMRVAKGNPRGKSLEPHRLCPLLHPACEGLGFSLGLLKAIPKREGRGFPKRVAVTLLLKLGQIWQKSFLWIQTQTLNQEKKKVLNWVQSL